MRDVQNAIATTLDDFELVIEAFHKPTVVYLHTADKYHRPRWPTITGAKRHRGEGAHGITAALSPLMTPSQQAVRTHVACQATFPCRFTPPWFAHTPAGWGPSGPRHRST